MVNQPMGKHGLGIFWCGQLVGWLLWQRILKSEVTKGPISPLLLVVEVLDVKTTYRKSCALNLLVGSDLTLDPPLKIECGP